MTKGARGTVGKVRFVSTALNYDLVQGAPGELSQHNEDERKANRPLCC